MEFQETDSRYRTVRDKISKALYAKTYSQLVASGDAASIKDVDFTTREQSYFEPIPATASDESLKIEDIFDNLDDYRFYLLPDNYEYTKGQMDAGEEYPTGYLFNVTDVGAKSDEVAALAYIVTDGRVDLDSGGTTLSGGTIQAREAIGIQGEDSYQNIQFKNLTGGYLLTDRLGKMKRKGTACGSSLAT